MPPETFIKPARSQLNLWRSLARATVRWREKLFLAEGSKVVAELLKSKWKVHALLVMEQKQVRWSSFVSELNASVAVYTLTETQWGRLSQDINSEGIMAVAEPTFCPDVSHLPTLPAEHIILAYRMNNPNNLGALIRTAHWFGIGTLLLSADSVDFTNPKVVRTSMGSLFHLAVVPEVDFADVIPSLKKNFLLVAGDVKNGTSPHPCPQPTALLFGSESHGLPEDLLELADERWNIPGAGRAESLSLPQAAAIMMYAATS
ncbi:MAG: RNA methyltransferase [Deltaproteobacteria bacterium]|nr:RNA methyltransferase [Deltaproteobacteria bacterium]